MRYEPALPESPQIRYEFDFEFNFWSLHTQNLLLLLSFLQPRIDLSDLKWDHAVTSWIKNLWSTFPFEVVTYLLVHGM